MLLGRRNDSGENVRLEEFSLDQIQRLGKVSDLEKGVRFGRLHRLLQWLRDTVPPKSKAVLVFNEANENLLELKLLDSVEDGEFPTLSRELRTQIYSA